MKKYLHKSLSLFILVINLSAISLGDTKILRGQMAQPLFNLSGDLICVYKDSANRMSLDTLTFQTEESFTETIMLDSRAFSPIIRKNRQGQIWMVWTEMNNGQSRILFGQLEGNQIASSQIVSEQEGFNFPPDLTFDMYDEPWIVWTNYRNSETRIFVKNMTSQNTWEILSGDRSSVQTPQILADPVNHIWVFWSGALGGNEKIQYRVFDRFNWSSLLVFDQENDGPQLSPKVALDHRGFIWLVWSGYDGEDYEIYSRVWDGNQWADKIPVTDNSKKNDVFPSLAAVSPGIPVVVWSQSGEGGSQIFSKYSRRNTWSEKIRVSSESGRNIFPKVTGEGDKVGIIWQAQNDIQKRILLFPFHRHPHQKEQILADVQRRSQRDTHLPLDEDKYIGFGDSITYGYISGEPAPEKGYLPRLKIMLDQIFGETEVVNEGIGAENTLDGLSRIDGILENHSAQFLLLMEGTNDLWNNSISAETTAFNLREMARKCLQAGTIPAIATIIPRTDQFWDWEWYRDKTSELNQKIKILAEELPLPYIDHFNLFYLYPALDGGWRSLFSDRNHPNEKGYQIMAQGWYDEIIHFPFPPMNVMVERRDAGDIYILPTYMPRPIPSPLPDTLFKRPRMNKITWLDNPKIFDTSKITGYRIYRKKEGESDDEFKLIDEIYDGHEYHDNEIIVSERYIYRVSTLSKDGVEGPLSESKRDY